MKALSISFMQPWADPDLTARGRSGDRSKSVNHQCMADKLLFAKGESRQTGGGNGRGTGALPSLAPSTAAHFCSIHCIPGRLQFENMRTRSHGRQCGWKSNFTIIGLLTCFRFSDLIRPQHVWMSYIGTNGVEVVQPERTDVPCKW